MRNNEMVKIATANFNRYAINNKGLFETYNKPSVTKKAVWADLVNECKACGGEDLRVISHNCMMFTAGYLFPDPETGVVMFKYITRNWSVVIEMPWLS